MTLKERLNPSDDALLIAAGNYVYAWAYDKPEVVGKLPGRVSALALDGETVVAGGAFKGVRDLEGKLVAGGFHSWSNLASRQGTLYGAMHAPGKMGIWNIREDACEIERWGRTHFMLGGEELYDSGQYTKYVETDAVNVGTRRRPQMEPQFMEAEERGLLLSLSSPDDPVEINYPVDAAAQGTAHTYPWFVASAGEIILYSEKEIAQFGWGYEPGRMYVHDAVRKEAVQAFRDNSWRIDPLSDDSPLESIWYGFCALWREHEHLFPKGAKTMRIMDYRTESVRDEIKLKPADFGTIQRSLVPQYYAAAHKAPLRSLGGKRLRQATEEFIREATEWVTDSMQKEYLRRTKISALAFHNDIIVAGVRKEFIFADESAREDNRHVLHTFPQPITAMLVVPEEIYNDGIKQKVLQNIRRRSLHARPQQARMWRAA
jgi:hypothetical protein